MSDAIPGQLTRQQLYDRIHETSKDELQRELNQLVQKQHRFNNPQLVVKEIDIVWLGEGISAGLANKKSDLDILKQFNLYSLPHNSFKSCLNNLCWQSTYL